VVLPQVPAPAPTPAPTHRQARPPAPPQTRPPARPPGPRWRQPRALAAGAAVGALALAAVGWWLVTDGPNGTDGEDGGGGTQATPRLAETTALVSRFVNGRAELVAVDVTTGTQVRPFPPVAGRLPSVSPDRRWVIYLAGDEAVTNPVSRRFEPHLMRADGSEDRRWLRGGDECPYAGRPTWNPQDPDQLAVSCLDAREHELGIWTVSADGVLGEPLVRDTGLMGDPTWTGDDTVVYATSHGAGTGRSSLMQVPADGSGGQPQPVEGEGDHPGMYDLNPDWSQDGVLYTRSSSFQGPGAIRVLGSDLATDAVAKSATWGPTGDSVVSLVGEDTAESLSRWSEDREPHPLDGITGQLGAPAWGSR
jgi:hypothetical protein